MSTPVIQIRNLGKKYKLGAALKQNTLREHLTRSFLSLWSRLHRENGNFKDEQRLSASSLSGLKDELWALKDVSFDVMQGEVVGIIGCNGAGKSTLLKILSRITEPTEGHICLSGNISSLLEVGTGFHQELTGRENIFLNGAILGMSKAEIKKKFDKIVAFAEIEKFLDTPVKHYSSGMYVRLAFAVAAHLDPEVLLIDEVLAVGDAAFQKKCLGKIEHVAEGGRTILFVSHQMDMIRTLCNRCIWLHQGEIRSDGCSEKVIEDYLNSFGSLNQAVSFKAAEDVNLAIQIIQGRLVDGNNRERQCFDVFDHIILDFMYVVQQPREGLIVNFELKRNGATLFLSFDTDTDTKKLETRLPGIYKCLVKLPCPLLKPGRYSVSMSTGISNVATYQRLEDILRFDVELLSRPSSLLSYAAKRRGLIAVPLVWHTELVRSYSSC